MIRYLFRRKSLFGPSPVGMVFSYLALGLWALVVLFPLYWLAVTSFKLPVDVNTAAGLSINDPDSQLSLV